MRARGRERERERNGKEEIDRQSGKGREVRLKPVLIISRFLHAR